MNELKTLALLGIVSVLWGVTNPLLKRASVGIENVKTNNFIYQFVAEIVFLASKINYVGPFLLNQLGGILFVYSLGLSDLSLAVPLTNSLTFLVTTLTGYILGEESLTPSIWVSEMVLCPPDDDFFNLPNRRDRTISDFLIGGQETHVGSFLPEPWHSS